MSKWLDGELLVYLRMANKDPVGVELLADAKVDDLFFAAEQLWGVTVKRIRFGEAELERGEALADVGLCSESTVEVFPGVIVKFMARSGVWWRATTVHANLNEGALSQVKLDKHMRIQDVPEGWILTPRMWIGDQIVLGYKKERRRSFFSCRCKDDTQEDPEYDEISVKISPKPLFKGWRSGRTMPLEELARRLGLLDKPNLEYLGVTAYPPRETYTVTVDPCETLVEAYKRSDAAKKFNWEGRQFQVQNEPSPDKGAGGLSDLPCPHCEPNAAPKMLTIEHDSAVGELFTEGGSVNVLFQ